MKWRSNQPRVGQGTGPANRPHPKRPKHFLDVLGLRPAEPRDSLRGTMGACLEVLQVVMAPASVRAKAIDFRRFADWCQERALHKPAEVTRPILERYQQHLYFFRKPNGQPLSAERQLVAMVHLKGYFRWATQHGLLPANPASDLLLPRKGVRLPRYAMSVAEVEAVLALPDVETLVGLRDRAMLEVLWATGMRRNELARLVLWDVHWEKGTVFVRLGKGRKDRVVPISDRALGWVRRYLDEARPRYAPSPDSGHLFLSESGDCLEGDSLTNLVGTYLRRAKIPAVGACHLFRHACATSMVEAGADIRLVQELLGHSSLESTQVYTRVSIARLKAVYGATHPGARSAEAIDAGGTKPELEVAPAPEQLLKEIQEECISEENLLDERGS